MAQVEFASPPKTDPACNRRRVFDARVTWELDDEERKRTGSRVVLTASPLPELIEPNDGTNLTVGVYPLDSTDFTDFTITYPAEHSFPFPAALEVKLYLGSASSPADSDRVDINVTEHPSHGGGTSNDLESASRIASGKLTGSRNAPPSATDTAELGGPDPLPFVLSGSTVINKGPFQHAAAVVCLVLGRKRVVKFAAEATFLPRDLFVITLDPRVLDLGFTYELYWVDELGAILQVDGNPIEP